MPQMSPLLWFNLLIMFLIMVSLFFSLTYFIKLPVKLEKKYKLIMSQQKTWKW